MHASPNRTWAVLLPMGIAMALGATSFTFGASGMQWVWADQPWVAVLLVVAGAAMIVGAVATRARQRRR